MISNYFYHEILRKTIVSFGTLFNNIQIKHKDNAGDDFSILTVPIAYGPVQKFLARIEQVPDLKKRVAITLPRMSFEMTGISYDSSRKSSTMQTFKTLDKTNNEMTKAFMPVPYNINIRLSIMSKLNEDALQIVEQILPYFQPHFNLTVDLVSSIGEKRDIPMILDRITMDDQYEGDFTTRRILIYTLDFTAKTYLFGPVGNGNEALIKQVQVDYYSDTNRINASRQLRYIAEPRALKDYNNDETTVISADINENSTQFEVSDATSLIEKSYIQIDEESMFIREINGNTLLVNRGQDGTSITSHTEGTAVNVINDADDELISLDDDFGFSEYRYNFDNDGKVYSTTKGTDV
jgi:T4-like virus Myoviridae tail sheath stabiliser